MRPTLFLFASTSLALLLSSTSHAAESSAPFDAASPHHCQAEHHDASAAEHQHCASRDPHAADEHGHQPPPPPHEAPLAAVKACLGKKVGAKTTVYWHGDSIPAVCQPYDGMLLAKPLRPLVPPAPPQDAPHPTE
ncbi:hypothetical protein DBR44_11970 [Aquitalea sp. FJL05]|uniref:hypothetical protein n=1 Tax=Aquitalea TaxID=407217 RepID=UPI000F5ACE1D|nr:MULTISPECIES: hypothetical protein [Aquitalea]RQO71156.1 hypothetical protein DBR44_11970 [Aquitalea sp. FJL05]